MTTAALAFACIAILAIGFTLGWRACAHFTAHQASRSENRRQEIGMLLAAAGVGVIDAEVVLAREVA
jgi:hypothetical protein